MASKYQKKTYTSWNEDNFLMEQLTSRYRIKFSYFKSRPYVHIRDLGREEDENDISSHRFITLHRDAIYKLSEMLPCFIDRLKEFDVTNDPEVLQKRFQGEKRLKKLDYISEEEEEEEEEEEVDQEEEEAKVIKKRKPKLKRKINGKRANNF